MTLVVDTFLASLDAALDAASAVSSSPGAVKSLDDSQLLVAQRKLADLSRAIGAPASLVAGEVGYRSRRELGYAGLAQREGFRTPEALVKHTTGSTGREAVTLVQVGTMVHDAVATAEFEVGEPWLLAVGAAVNAGTVSVDAAKAIRVGLGQPSSVSDTTGAGVTAAELAAAVEALLSEAAGLDADRLLQRAKELRDDLDEAGIVERERVIHEQRGFRRVKRPNGVNRYIIDPDLESAAFWDDTYDKLTSPRRGGPRFISDTDKEWAEKIATDERTTVQYVHDAITQLVKIGVDTDSRNNGTVIGSRLPAVRVLVTGTALETGTGHGRIEGTTIPISLPTVERIICTSGTIPIVFDSDGQILDLGRESRLFSAKQKRALADRDGGCIWGNGNGSQCDCPPSWTEAHHIDHWLEDHGETNVADGILLCRYHHMLLHNNGWKIVRENSVYWLIPPPELDPNRTPRQLHSKSAALRDLHHQTELATTR